MTTLTADEVYRTDAEGLRSSLRVLRALRPDYPPASILAAAIAGD